MSITQRTVRAAGVAVGACLVVAMAAPAAGQATAPATAPATRPAGPACYALLVGGMPGTPIHARRYADWLKRFRAYLTGPAGVPAANVVVLSGDETFAKDPIVKGAATAEAVLAELKRLAATVQPQDQFILLTVGHASKRLTVPTLVLPGPDLSAQDLRRALDALPTKQQVLLLFSADSGKWVEELASEQRVIVAAAMPEEGAEPVYAEFFLRGLESKRCDGEGAPAAGRKDGTLTLLEAYNWSTYQTALWIARIRAVELKAVSSKLMIVVEEKGWNVDGRESVEIFKKLCVAAPGTPGSRILGAGSRGDIDDPVVPLRATEQYDSSLSQRRMITEHACLEDCGQKTPVTALAAEQKDYEPLAGTKDDEPGRLARRVVLGRGGLLPAKGD